MQVLDASLGLLPLSELVGSLPNLLGRAEDNVSKPDMYCWWYS